MRHGQLSDYFKGIGVKQLSAVDAEPNRSNQHEIGTTKEMRRHFLGECHKFKFSVTFIWLGDNNDMIILEDWATHYDSRINKPDRSPEWRLYYPSNQVTKFMKAGDTLFLAKAQSGQLLFIVTSSGSISESQLCWLFGFAPKNKTFLTKKIDDNFHELNFTSRLILEQLGVRIGIEEDSRLESIFEQYGPDFPKTKTLAEIARKLIGIEVNVTNDPDFALISWIEFEEEIFRYFEHKFVSERLEQGFICENEVDVDGFIKFSLSVNNRRKSRMGYALENHTAFVLDSFGIKYQREVTTEQKKKPDFLFPSKELYNQLPFGHELLIMLATKSTCKDRWRQVINEADKIPKKHLLTLEPRISGTQTCEMKSENIQLIVPSQIRDSYTDEQKEWIWTVKDFMDYVSQNQKSLMLD